MKVVYIVSVLFHLLHTYALLPIRDFRVNDLVTGNKEIKEIKEVKEIESIESIASFNRKSVKSTIIPQVTFKSINQTQVLYTDNLNSIYYIYVTLEDKKGSQSFPLLLDTGSAVSWVYNSSCNINSCQYSNVTKFNQDIESLGAQFSITYTNDQVTGNYISLGTNKIVMELGDVSNDFKINDFSLGITNDSPSIFNGFYVSGILGITTGNTDGNIVSQMRKSELIDKEVFALYLKSPGDVYKVTNEGTSVAPELGGLVLFGQDVEDNMKTFVGDNPVKYTDVVSNNNNYWLINISETGVIDAQGKKQNNVIDNSRLTIIDSGTTGIVFPFDDAVTIHKSLFGDNGFIYDQNGNFAFFCNYTDAEIVFNIGDITLNMNSDNFKGQAYINPPLIGYCASKIQGLNNYGHWVLGQAFLKSYYTIFDLHSSRIGFAEADLKSFAVELEDTEKFSTSTSTSSKVIRTNTSVVTDTFTSKFNPNSSTDESSTSSLTSSSSFKNTTNSHKTKSHTNDSSQTISILGLPIITVLLASLLIL